MEEDLVSCQRTDELQDPIDLPPPSDNEENDEVGLYVPMSKFWYLWTYFFLHNNK